MKINKDYYRLFFFRTLGNFLIIISIIMILKTWLPALGQEAKYTLRNFRGVQTQVAVVEENIPLPTPTPKNNPFQNLLNQLSEKQEVIIPQDTDFSIVIPKIAANSRVVANVNSSNYDQYISALQYGVAHAQGTALPGDGGHMYLFAHSTDNILNVGTYNAVFYLLYKLEEGDKIYLFYKGKKHLYKVIGKKTVAPTEIQYLTRSSSSEFLTLQTCWPPGTTLKRLVVFAVPVVK